ncbi:hypothetical protein [Hespellia stercorisuis]|uniref:Uncharacterized protein n=1 Tax=Hespellia stercorisuis DSM 15480 TaxID=1121950 RepID=A0A1M6TBW0_9FIRM|nr:hypothetical protein [Hespellia stercorisuis]SHK54369.1 hypothetical protein SAMN02745243_03185 [Hespellia stercorisuis DSM 15480]
MKHKDREKERFLMLCGQKDRALILGEEKLKIRDFDRLTYLTDYLGFQDFNLEFWFERAMEFKEEFERIEKYIMEADVFYCEEIIEDALEMSRLWIKDFYEAVPNEEARRIVAKLIDKQDTGMIMEITGQADTL